MKRTSAITSSVWLAIWLLWASPGQAQQSPAARSAETQSGSITGRVVDSSGQPINGASVSAFSLYGSSRQKTTAADSRGDFKIDGLGPGLYNVFASVPGYLTGGRTPGDAPAYNRPGDSVTFTMTKGGVIAGTVTGPNGPVVGVGVFAMRVRDASGIKIPNATPGGFERRTDDRGMFRFYRLPAGSYVLVATAPRLGTILPSAFDNDVPTFYPSSTRDTAAEILVHEGDEITADIQYRGEPGHAISGKIWGAVADQLTFTSDPQITITDVRSRAQLGTASTPFGNNSSFAIYGIPDGEYELFARQYLPTRDELRSRPLRIKVSGADVTGVSMTLAPLASIEGHLVFEPDPKAECAKRKDTAAQETPVYANRIGPEKNADPKTAELDVPLSLRNSSSFAVGNAKGLFTFRGLLPGSYRIDPRPQRGWYLRSVTLSTAARTTGDALSVRAAERVSGLTVTITEGGALMHGHISANDSKSLPAGARVYLVPAEREAANNVYRFYEAAAEREGSFTLDNVAPGRYLIVARRTEENESGVVKFVRLDEALRTTVLKEAEAMKKAVALKPCEQVADFDLPWVAPH